MINLLKIDGQVFIVFLCVSSTSFFLTCSADSNLITSENYDDVTNCEKVFFGRVDTSNTFIKRLDLLEIAIFGRVRSGSQTKRLQRIIGTLGVRPAVASSSAQPATSPTSLSPSPKNQSEQPTGEDLSLKLPDSGAGLATDHSEDIVKNKLAGSELPTPSMSEGLSSSFALADVAQPPDSLSVGSAKNLSQSSALSKSSKPISPKSVQKLVGTDKSSIPLGKENPKVDIRPGHSEVAVQSKAKTLKVTSNPSIHRLERPGHLNQMKNEAAKKASEIDKLFQQGIQAYRNHHEDEANSCFKQIVIIDPRNTDAFFNLGSVAESRKEYVDALTFYRAALDVKPLDKDFKMAVTAMEEELHQQRLKSQGKPTGTSITTNSSSIKSAPESSVNKLRQDAAINSPVKSATMQTSQVTDISSIASPVAPIQQLDPKTFSIQASQNGLSVPFSPLNSVGAPYQGMPIYTAPLTLSGNIPANNIGSNNASPTKSKGNNFGTILSTGAGFALRGSPLHCPICRVLGGLH